MSELKTLSLGQLMSQKFDLEDQLRSINDEIKKQELKKYNYLVNKCFKIKNIRYKILEIVRVEYRSQDRIDIIYKALKIGDKTITTVSNEQSLLIVIENNFIDNKEFNDKFTEMVDYIKNNILNEHPAP